MYVGRLIGGPLNEAETKFGTVKFYKEIPPEKVRDCQLCTECKLDVEYPACKETCDHFVLIEPFTEEELNFVPPEGSVICRKECKTCVLEKECPVKDLPFDSI